MKLNLTLQQIAHIIGGELQTQMPQTKITAFCTDSRTITPGDGFIALKGARLDARQFIPQVAKQGAAVIVAQKGYQVPAHIHTSFIWVEDPLKALQTLAKYHRAHHTLKVAAITGSNGKSTTKQMLRSVCQTAGETVANVGNLNNQFGVPFSLLEIQPKHQYGVFELGASHPGDILEIASLAMPDVAVITNVGPSHLEFFHDLETVYRTKTEIIQCLRPGGTLVYNIDDPLLARLHTDYKGQALCFGFGPQADIRVLETENFAFTYQGRAHLFTLKLERHDKLNAAAACAAALALQIPMDTIQKGLSSFTPMPMRLERVQKGNITFILDCYNANPQSMKNALEILGRTKTTPRIAVLGDMKELGASSKEYHRQVARQLLDNGADYIFLAGPEIKYTYEALKELTGIKLWYGLTPNEWLADLKKVTAAGGTCLLKASRSMNFETIFKEI